MNYITHLRGVGSKFSILKPLTKNCVLKTELLNSHLKKNQFLKCSLLPGSRSSTDIQRFVSWEYHGRAEHLDMYLPLMQDPETVKF